MSKSKNFKVIALILITSALLMVAINPGAKAQTQDSVYIYTSLGGSISTMGATLTGGTSYNFENGTAVDLNATAGSGFQFLCWEVVSASGATTSTANPLAYTPDVANSAIQAMFIPTSNATTTSTASGSATIDILASVGGSTNPTAATYTNYTVGSTNNFQAVPGTGFKFLYWIAVSANGANTYTSDTVALDVTANSCGLQAMFVPTSSSVSLPTPTPAVPEFSSAVAGILVVMLVAIAFGTFAVTRRNKK